jgi:hypothetical protein
MSIEIVPGQPLNDAESSVEANVDEVQATVVEDLEIMEGEGDIVPQNSTDLPESAEVGASGAHSNTAELAPETDPLLQTANSVTQGELEPATDALEPLRARLFERIAESSRLPRGMHDRLRRVVQQSSTTHEAGNLLVPADAVLEAIESWAPTALRFDARSFQRPEHPAGDGFFTGDPNDVSDEQADRIARQQLQRSGYLPREIRG